jgi:hypothetical protein
MNIPTSFTVWYAAIILALIAILATFLVIRSFLKWLASVTVYFLLKYVVYYSPNVIRASGYNISPIYVLITLTYTIGNGICMGWGTQTVRELSTRSASLLATNLVLLLPGANVVADAFKISLRDYRKGHTAIATTALVEGIVHTALEVKIHGWRGDLTFIAGVIASDTNPTTQPTDF